MKFTQESLTSIIVAVVAVAAAVFFINPAQADYGRAFDAPIYGAQDNYRWKDHHNRSGYPHNRPGYHDNRCENGHDRSGYQQNRPEYHGKRCGYGHDRSGNQHNRSGSHDKRFGYGHDRSGYQHGHGGRWCSDDWSARLDKMINHIDERLQLTDAQRPAWKTLTETIRTSRSDMNAVCKERQKDEKAQTMPQRLGRYENTMSSVLNMIQTVRPALDEFYAVLDEQQRMIFDQMPMKPRHP